jgi:hypothetical protein
VRDILLFSLIPFRHHGDGLPRALFGTNTATLAKIQIGLKVIALIPITLGGTVEGT